MNNFIFKKGKRVLKRKGMKFITALKDMEEIIGIQDGHILTNERVIEIPEDYE